jgi:hypothetical protein
MPGSFPSPYLSSQLLYFFSISSAESLVILGLRQKRKEVKTGYAQTEPGMEGGEKMKKVLIIALVVALSTGADRTGCRSYPHGWAEG